MKELKGLKRVDGERPWSPDRSWNDGRFRDASGKEYFGFKAGSQGEMGGEDSNSPGGWLTAPTAGWLWNDKTGELTSHGASQNNLYRFKGEPVAETIIDGEKWYLTEPQGQATEAPPLAHEASGLSQAMSTFGPLLAAAGGANLLQGALGGGGALSGGAPVVEAGQNFTGWGGGTGSLSGAGATGSDLAGALSQGPQPYGSYGPGTQVAGSVGPGGLGGGNMSEPWNNNWYDTVPEGYTAPNTPGITYESTFTPQGSGPLSTVDFNDVGQNTDINTGLPINSAPSGVGGSNIYGSPGVILKALTAAGMPYAQAASMLATGGSALTKAFDALSGGDSGPLGGLLKQFLPAALAAGVLEGMNQKSSSTKVEYPEWYTRGSQEALGLAKEYADTPFEAYTGERVAPLSANENQAIEMAKTNAGRWEPMVDEAGNLIRQGSKAITPEEVRAMMNPALAGLLDPNKLAGMFDDAGNLIKQGGTSVSGDAVTGYMNPYIAGALDPVARKLNVEAALKRNIQKANEARAGAFDTERARWDENITEKNRLQAISDLYGTGYATAYDKAMAAAQADKSRQITAGGALSGEATNIGNLTNTGWNTAEDALAADRVRSIAGGGALNTAARTGSDLTGADISRLGSTGALERGVRQAGNDFDFSQYQDRLALPAKKINAYSSAMRGTGGSTTTSTPATPSLLGSATAALGAYGALTAPETRNPDGTLRTAAGALG